MRTAAIACTKAQPTTLFFTSNTYKPDTQKHHTNPREITWKTMRKSRLEQLEPKVVAQPQPSRLPFLSMCSMTQTETKSMGTLGMTIGFRRTDVQSNDKSV
jgi:hypothetical protein